MKSSGFTLLETIIYCALFSVLMSGVIVAVYALMSSSKSIEEKTNIIAEATFINQKLAWAMSGTSQVLIVDSNTIQIFRPDLDADNPLTFSVSDGRFYLSRGSSIPVVISGDQFVISNLTFNLDMETVRIRYKVNDLAFDFIGFVR